MQLIHIKKSLFILFLLINGLSVFAQNTSTNTAANGSAPTDSIRSKKSGATKIRIVDGSVMNSTYNVIENLGAAKEFSLFINAINTADLSETFKTTGPITVFAPVNSAFEKLTPAKRDSLLDPKNKLYLTNLLAYHAISGKVSSKDIEKKVKLGNGQATFITLAGGKLTARINENRNIVLTDENGGQSIVSNFDIEQSNGLLDVINTVLMPKDKL